MINKCPGQDDKNLKSENIACSKCGFVLEIFSDEVKVKCPKCGNLVCKERLPSCIDWCKYAKECIGEEKFKKRSRAT
jgi:predicted RNA-binding Zn-ribbon protein involved in translation (DUF1610 family)